jgi:hypothetical protein
MSVENIIKNSDSDVEVVQNDIIINNSMENN